jgi:beta-galactosidase
VARLLVVMSGGGHGVALLTSYVCGGRGLLLEGPRPDFWRAPTDNDYGGHWQDSRAVWKGAGDGFRVDR